MFGFKIKSRQETWATSKKISKRNLWNNSIIRFFLSEGLQARQQSSKNWPDNIFLYGICLALIKTFYLCIDMYLFRRKTLQSTLLTSIVLNKEHSTKFIELGCKNWLYVCTLQILRCSCVPALVQAYTYALVHRNTHRSGLWLSKYTMTPGGLINIHSWYLKGKPNRKKVHSLGVHWHLNSSTTMKKAILIFCILILNMTYALAYSETILDPVSSTFFSLFNKD